MIVYAIKNKINNKLYIGQTVGPLKKRWNAHVRKSSGCTAISAAIQKYGIENFEIRILSKCTSLEEMNHRETYYIKLFNTIAPYGYNICFGGGNRRLNPETVKKITIKNKDKKRNENFRKMRSRIQTGKKHSKITKIRMSLASKGKAKSEAHRANISKAKKGIAISESQKNDIRNTLRKPIMCNETNQIFSCTKEAAKALKISPHRIGDVLKGRLSSYKDLTFSYVKKNNQPRQ